MNLFQITRALQKIAGTNPYINSVGDGSIYNFFNANPSIKYGVFFLTQTSHRENDYFDWYGFNIFVVDRLVDDLESNRLQIQSIAKDVISNTLKIFITKYIGSTHTEVRYVPFTERFVDLTAGVYATVEIKVPKAIICEEDFEELVVFTGDCQECYKEGYEDGLTATYWDGYESGRTYQKSLLVATQFTENGTYAREDGYSVVTVNVDVERYFNDGYASGTTDQKNKLIPIYITENGQYNRENGYNSIVVDVETSGDCSEAYESGLTNGYNSGITYQKSLLVSTAITINGTYAREDGYNSVVVNIPQTGHTDQELQDAYNSGITYQKSLLSSIYITENGQYNKIDGYSSVTVNIEQTGYTQEDLDAAYNRGFEDGLDACGGSGYATEYLTIEAQSGGTLYWKATNDDLPEYVKTIEYSKNDGEWTSVTSTASGTVITTVVAGDKVRLRGQNETYCDTLHRNMFATDFKFIVYGNIMSLIYKDNFRNRYTLTAVHTFCSLFRYCSQLTDASNLILPATTLTEGCYGGMFQGCSILTAAPALPATTLAKECYAAMFEGCYNLTIAPELPATTLAEGCYKEMFQFCVRLTTIPELPASTLVKECYYCMFQSCNKVDYIKCLATDISAYYCTRLWVDDTAATGTFVKPTGMSSWTTGYNGIPTGWTIVNI